MPAPHRFSDLIAGKHRLLVVAASLGLISAAVPAGAYTPQLFDTSKDKGQDFTAVPVNTPWNASNGINRTI